ncbi:hypothetical protein HPP92_003203 [Vanilla planifolia]|uniref:Uncharacterized protein n=1 Tax=Vanilla planifolia TaxID=51239 RepID=A0A835SBC2_VANPL|nr:hypothetical protein HPP92_003203 [Vanilla planifolia]
MRANRNTNGNVLHRSPLIGTATFEIAGTQFAALPTLEPCDLARAPTARRIIAVRDAVTPRGILHVSRARGSTCTQELMLVDKYARIKRAQPTADRPGQKRKATNRAVTTNFAAAGVLMEAIF